MSANPTLLYSADQDDLRAAVRDVLNDHVDWADLIAVLDESALPLATVWEQLKHGVGVAGLAVTEDLGGAGGTWSEVAIVLEELGRSVAPAPFLTSSVVATALLASVQAPELLKSVADGSSTAAVLVPLASTSLDVSHVVTRDGATLNGQVRLVAGAREADVLLVLIGDSLVAVETANADITSVPSLDETRPLADVTLTEAHGTLIAQGADVVAAGRHAFDVAAALLASEQLGLAESCLEMTIEYMTTRHQFGRPLGSFQALKHRLADCWVSIAKARATARYAASCAASESKDLPVAASVAQAVCADVAVRVAEECVQLHGGIGFTWEHPAHVLLKRARADELAFGSTAWHRTRLGTLAHLEPAAEDS